MQSTGQTSMHFSSFVQLSTMTKAMNHFSSDEFVKFPILHRRGAPAEPIRVSTSKTRAYGVCNSCAKCRVLFVACIGRKSDLEFASWIERPNKGGILPTSDLGLSQLGPYIPAAEVDSTGRIGHGALPPFTVAVMPFRLSGNVNFGPGRPCPPNHPFVCGG